MKIKSFKETFWAYVSTFTLTAMFLLGYAIGYDLFITNNFIDDLSNNIFTIIFYILFLAVFFIFWLTTTYKVYDTKIIKFKIISYNKWNHDKQIYEELFQVFKVVETKITFYQWHYKTIINSPQINEKTITEKHDELFNNGNYFDSKENAMKYIFNLVKDLLEIKNTEKIETYQNIKELEEITFEEVVKQLNKS